MRCSHDTVTETVVVLPREIRHMDVRTEQALSAHGKTTQPGAGHLGDQLFRELDGGDVADAVGEVAHFHHLLGDGVDDFLAAVADVDGPHAAGHGVKIGLAVDVGDAHPFALHINGGLEILVLGQVVPNVLFVQSDQFSFIVSHSAWA